MFWLADQRDTVPLSRQGMMEEAGSGWLHSICPKETERSRGGNIAENIKAHPHRLISPTRFPSLKVPQPSHTALEPSVQTHEPAEDTSYS